MRSGILAHSVHSMYVFDKGKNGKPNYKNRASIPSIWKYSNYVTQFLELNGDFSEKNWIFAKSKNPSLVALICVGENCLN